MRRTLIAVLMLCIMLISATAFASPKSDFKQIWEAYTFKDGRYQIYLDVKFSVFGTTQVKSKVDITQEPFFLRSETTTAMFGQKAASTGYLVQNGNVMDGYYQDTVRTDEGTEKRWVHFAYDMPKEEETNTITYDDFVRSVELVKETDKGQLYAVKLDGRELYKTMKKRYDEALVAGSEASEALDNIADKDKREQMLAIADEILKTWKDTDNVIVLVRVKDSAITGVQTELSSQFNSVMHIIAASADIGQKGSDYKLGGLMEAFFQVEKMRLTVIPDGEAQYTAVPDEVLASAADQDAPTNETEK